MSLSTGQTLSFYEILGPLGAGGMGEVYRAKDTRLEREVAIKVLPDELADDEERLRRFEREAKTLAALNHPNVATIYGIDQEGDTCFIALELIPGQDLSERLDRGPLTIEQAIEVCLQIADGLAAAHAAGVVHRDLKPANVRLMPDGRVKLLDFGLAKPMANEAGVCAADVSRLATRADLVLGTPPYMSPEQAEGAPVSQAADVWAFGCVFYECLTGKRAFVGKTLLELFSKITTRDPDWLALPEATPGAVRSVLRRALAKRPEERRLQMDAIRGEVTTAVPYGAASPTRASPPARSAFVGRDAEREQLVAAVERVCRGEGGLVLLAGEPGAGKTCLAEEALREGSTRGLLVLKGHAYEEDGAPYVTGVEILEDMLRLLPQDRLRDMLGPNASELARLLPELRRRYSDIPEPASLPAEQQRRYLFNSVLEFLERASRAVPMVMLLDDLHWADESSLLLLEHLAPHLPEMSVLMVGTYRDVELEVGKPFAKTLARLVRQKQARRIQIRRFEQGDVADLLAALGREAPPQALVEAVFRETEGNPFFVTEVFAHLAEEGVLFDEEGAWRADLDVSKLDVPEGVRLVIGRRLERLDPETPKILTVAATVGLRFDLAVVERVVGDSDSVLDALEEAEAARLVSPVEGRREPRYEFVHALVRHTLWGMLSVPRRQRLHLRIADAMEEVHRSKLDERAADVAQHLYQAGAAADPARTRSYLVRAAQRSLEASAADEALLLVDRALEEESELDPLERAELYHLRGVVQRTLGRWADAGADWMPTLPVFEAEGRGELVAEMCESMALKELWDDEIERARELAERGLRAIGDEASPWRCRLLSCLGHGYGNDGNHELAERLNSEAIAMAEELGDEKLIAGAYVGRLYQGEHWLRARMQADCGERAIEIARRSGSAWDLATVMGASVLGFISSGRRERAESILEELLPLSLLQGHLGGEVHSILNPVQLRVMRGDLTEARDCCVPCLERCYEMGMHWTSCGVCTSGLVELHLGEAERCLEAMEQAVRIEVSRNFAGYERAHLFFARAHFGHPEAASLMHAQAHLLPEPGVPNPVGRWITGLATIEAAALLGEQELAASRHGSLDYLLEEGTIFPWMLGLTERFAGIAAAEAQAWDDAERHFETALRQSLEMPHRVEEPQIEMWFARMLRRRGGRGDAERANEMLTSASTKTRELGMRLLERRIARMLERA